MGGTKARAAIAVVVLCVLTTGCLGAVTDQSPEETTELSGDYSADEFDELLSSATTANEETETFSVDMSMAMTGAGESVRMEATGNADLAAQEMKLDYEMTGLGMGGLSEFVMYVDGEDAYVQANDEWMQLPAEEANGDIWNVEDQLAIAEAQYEYGDVHVEDGDGVVEVTTELDTDAMSNFLAEAESADPAMADAGEVEWRNVEIVERFDAETNRLRVTEMTAEMSQNGQTLDYSFEMQIDDVNEDLETAVPEEAIEAAEERSGSSL